MCKYCEVKSPFFECTNEYGDIICETNYGSCQIIKSKNDGSFYVYLCGPYEDFSEPIKYCPFCGRKLNE